MAQAYFKCGQFEECYATYGNALEWLCENDAQKTSIVICMARLAYAFQVLSLNKVKLVLVHLIIIINICCRDLAKRKRYYSSV